jgi:hypothetical protein
MILALCTLTCTYFDLVFLGGAFYLSGDSVAK